MGQEARPTDEDLVRRARAGDEAAVEFLFERHLPDMRRRVRAKMPAALRAKVGESDVIQDAYLAAFASIGDFVDRGDGSYAAWLRRILERKVLNEVRRYAGVDKRDARREARLATGEGALLPARGRPSPSVEAMGKEESEHLSAAIESLPDDHRTVIRLVEWEGLSFGEVGARMARSADAARMLYSRALARLADLLGDEGRAR